MGQIHLDGRLLLGQRAGLEGAENFRRRCRTAPQDERNKRGIPQNHNEGPCDAACQHDHYGSGCLRRCRAWHRNGTALCDKVGAFPHCGTVPDSGCRGLFPAAARVRFSVPYCHEWCLCGAENSLPSRAGRPCLGAGGCDGYRAEA